MTKKETKEPFNLEEALMGLELPNMLIEGFKSYIDNNKIKIKTKKDFEKELKKFKELQL